MMLGMLTGQSSMTTSIKIGHSGRDGDLDLDTRFQTDAGDLLDDLAG